MSNTLASRIKEIVDSSGLNQEEFAKKVPMSQPYLSQIINGSKEPSERIIQNIATRFSVNEEWLLGKSDIKKPLEEDEVASYVDDILHDGENPLNITIKAILKAYSECTVQDQKAIRKFAESFLKNIKNESRG